MVAAISGGLTVQVDWLGLRVGGQPALSLQSSNEPVGLVQSMDALWKNEFPESRKRFEISVQLENVLFRGDLFHIDGDRKLKDRIRIA